MLLIVRLAGAVALPPPLRSAAVAAEPLLRRLQPGPSPELFEPVLTYPCGAQSVPTCWVVVGEDGYSAHATPYTTPALAQLAYVDAYMDARYSRITRRYYRR